MNNLFCGLKVLTNINGNLLIFAYFETILVLLMIIRKYLSIVKKKAQTKSDKIFFY